MRFNPAVIIENVVLTDVFHLNQHKCLKNSSMLYFVLQYVLLCATPNLSKKPMTNVFLTVLHSDSEQGSFKNQSEGPSAVCLL